MSEARAIIERTLARFGLPPSEAAWAIDQLTQGRSQQEILLEIETRDAFKDRFPHIQARLDAGLSPMTPAEIVQYEEFGRQIMRQAGLPPGFYDDPSDFVDLIVNDVSPQELSERVSLAESQVLNAPPEVLDAFMNLTGTDGIGAVTALLLDADRAVPALERQVRQAQVSGAARIVGVEVDQETAGRLAELGVDLNAARSGLLQVQAFSPLFRETATEGRDLTESQGALAAFGADQSSAEAIESRRQARAAQFNRGGGGAGGLAAAE